jgi:hypothetical protein
LRNLTGKRLDAEAPNPGGVSLNDLRDELRAGAGRGLRLLTA